MGMALPDPGYDMWLYGVVAGTALALLVPFLLFTLVPRFSGRHMLGFAVGMFAIVIAVNLWMAFKAVNTFPGLEAVNGYISSQNFNAERAAQDRLGWTATPGYDGKELTLRIVDRHGQPAPVGDLRVSVGRPTHIRDDQTPDLRFENGAWRAPLQLNPGVWVVHLRAHAPDGTLFQQRISHYHGSTVN